MKWAQAASSEIEAKRENNAWIKNAVGLDPGDDDDCVDGITVDDWVVLEPGSCETLVFAYLFDFGGSR